MKDSENKARFYNFLAFIALVVFAVLEIFNFLNPLLKLGTTLFNILTAIKNICVILVVGIAGYKFAEGKGKGTKITFWISIAIFVLSTILLFVFNRD